MYFLAIGIFGACIGSFLNVVILRLPKNESIALPSSHCPHCLHPLKWYHNIPLISWLGLKGKCAFCRTPISKQYPLVEAACALCYLLVAWRVSTWPQALLLGTIFSLLLALSIIDMRYKAVPDALSLPALFLSFLYRLPLESLQNGLVFLGAFALLRLSVSAISGKEAMGEADSIIAGIIGAILGITLGFAAIYLAALIALVAFMLLRKKGYELPFIPFLSLGLFVAWIFDQPILTFMEHWYE